jgi:hypothetical protein
MKGRIRCLSYCRNAASTQRIFSAIDFTAIGEDLLAGIFELLCWTHPGQGDNSFSWGEGSLKGKG